MMEYKDREEPGQYNVNHIIAKSLYFGLVLNIIFPAILIFICYYINDNQPTLNRVGNFAMPLFYIIVVLAILQGGLAFYLRNKILNIPVIENKGTFSEDLAQALGRHIRPVFILIALIAVYGFIYFFLTGRFKEALMMTIFSYLIFQVIRPRFGFVRKLIKVQEKFAGEGKFIQRQ